MHILHSFRSVGYNANNGQFGTSWSESEEEAVYIL